MSRLLLMMALILAASSLVCGQSMNQSTATLQQTIVQVDSIPLSDKLDAEQSRTATSNSKAGAPNRVPDAVNERDEIGGRFWGSAEYLLWRTKKSNLPPLITTGSDFSAALIGDPGTVIALGGNKLDRGKFPGGRFTVGMWLNEKQSVGVELSYFFLKQRTFNFQISSDCRPGSQDISRPFIEAHSNHEDVSVITYCVYSLRGSSAVISPSKLQGTESNLIYQLSKTHLHLNRISLLVGFRYLDLNEGLTITDITNSGFHNFDIDQFSTRNQFYGAQLGASSSLERHLLSLKIDAKVAIGSNRESVGINGETFSNINSPHYRVGGLLAVISNIGQYHRNELTILPEVKAQLAYQLTRHLRAFAGYDFLYLNKVVRPGDQIDRVVNPFLTPVFFVTPRTLVSPLRPAFTFNDTSFWAQGLNIGIQTRF